MPRFLQLTPKPPYPPRDGGALGTAYFLEMVHSIGWTVHTLVMSTYKHPYDPTYPTPVPITAVQVNTRPTLWGALANLLHTREPYHVVRFRSSAYAEALMRLIDSFQPDLIQVESPYLTPYVQHLKIPKVYRLHNIEAQIWRRHAEEQRLLLRPYFRLQAKRIEAYERHILSLYDGLLPISEKEAQFAQESGYQGLMEIFPFGINLTAYTAPPLTNRPPRIGFIGGLDWLPNQQGIVWFLEKVWPSFRRRHPDAHLYIAGRNTPSWLYKYADARTHILGEVPDAQAFFHQNDIFIAPLFSGSGIRIKLIEAFATGRAIVATSIAAESLIYEEGKHLLLADTPEAFGEALSALYQDRNLRERLGRAARELAERVYDRQQLLPRLKRFYETLLAR
ncbi:MAG: glycosyltransferase family 4 protein [Bacteroidia bacterium]|nr:glycosyltransferase family 4 protein [Bacteroidia bacterium]MCX7763489.1 glycosyltransferase family 4 protein [Bacteroidia bacterium]MDW8057397.1 glycosyltransferase family 4 protein [Bacteroidia bacterium]